MTGRENTRRQLLQEIRWAEGMVLRDTEGWEGEDEQVSPEEAGGEA